MKKEFKEAQKEEALKRMKYMHLLPNIIEEFEKEGKVNYSESVGPLHGILYWLDNKPVFTKIKDDFEKEYNALVYHAILTQTSYGLCLSLLYVSDTKSEWKDDNNLLKEGYTYAYVYNITFSDCSEIGTIGIEQVNGGLRRTA